MIVFDKSKAKALLSGKVRLINSNLIFLLRMGLILCHLFPVFEMKPIELK